MGFCEIMGNRNLSKKKDTDIDEYEAAIMAIYDQHSLPPPETDDHFHYTWESLLGSVHRKKPPPKWPKIAEWRNKFKQCWSVDDTTGEDEDADYY